MKLQFNLSPTRIQEAVKEGIVLSSKMTIDVDLEALSFADRETLSRNVVYRSQVDVFEVNLLSGDYNDYRSTSNPTSSEKIEGIISQMSSLDAARAAKIEEQKKEKAIKSEIDDILAGIEDENFQVERYDSTVLYFKLKTGGFSREFRLSSPDKTSVNNMLEFVKSEQLLSKLGEVKSEYEKSVKEAAEKTAYEANRKAALVAGRTILLNWATENGSELLKLRIKHNQNWQNLAEQEWAIAHTEGFGFWFDDEELETWVVNNASLDQLQLLEEAVVKNPDFEIDIIRCKFMYDEQDYYGERESDYYHRTFLRCEVKTPIGYVHLIKEIKDADDDE